MKTTDQNSNSNPNPKPNLSQDQEIQIELSLDSKNPEMELVAESTPKFNEEEKTWDYGTVRVVQNGVLLMHFHDILIKLYANDQIKVTFGTTSYKMALNPSGSKLHTVFHDSFTPGPGSEIHTFSTPFQNTCGGGKKQHAGSYSLNDLYRIAKLAKIKISFLYRRC
jgi:hypothetical protein